MSLGAAPTLPALALVRGVEHLSLVERASPSARFGHPLAEAAAVLEQAGIAAKFSELSRRAVIGGRRRIMIGPIHAYEDGFSLWQADDGAYHAVVAGNGQLGIRSGATTLEAAIGFIIDHYATTAAR
jgi:hypothetical protein